MISYTDKSIFDIRARAHMVPVNVVGVMGAGLAKEYKKRYPSFYEAYRAACRTGMCAIGNNYHYHLNDQNAKPSLLIATATKKHWRDPSDLEYVQQGLTAFRYVQAYMSIESVAIPALGCGLGGLAWSEVKPLIEDSLGHLKCEITVCLPKGVRL